MGGELWSSEELAAQIDKLGTYGTSHVVFVIGGSHGLADEVLRRAHDATASAHAAGADGAGYRAVKINRGEPYHK